MPRSVPPKGRLQLEAELIVPSCCRLYAGALDEGRRKDRRCSFTPRRERLKDRLRRPSDAAAGNLEEAPKPPLEALPHAREGRFKRLGFGG